MRRTHLFIFAEGSLTQPGRFGVSSTSKDLVAIHIHTAFTYGRLPLRKRLRFCEIPFYVPYICRLDICSLGVRRLLSVSLAKFWYSRLFLHTDVRDHIGRHSPGDLAVNNGT